MDNTHKPDIIGYTTQDITDSAGRLLLAEGAPVTAALLERLRERGLKLTIADSPLGVKMVQLRDKTPVSQQAVFQAVFKVPERLDQKFEKLDLISVGKASQYVSSIMQQVSDDIFLRDNLNALAQRFSEVYSHSINVGLLVDAIAQKMNMFPAERRMLGLAALFHDIGKILLPPTILRGSNADDEWKLYYRQHPRIGADILAAGQGLESVALVVHQHHEQYSGNGYPEGLKESEIHPHAHIVRVADVFDRITSDYFRDDALSPTAAIDYIVENKGTMFHLAVVDKFVEVFQAANS